uniref:Uncharacterized protein LOC111116851 isoform X1 n=1 Tax=Crassostrea virginica TaxID=6565 RepID=A0A8B8C778_CRAVI|nr:uncharacterized protein LOC111116851 isoform X1 [Crassostrea virginica]
MANGAHDNLTDSDSDSTSSSSAQFSKYVKRFPNKSSQWSIEHLAELGVVYDEVPTDLGKMLTDLRTLKSVVRNGLSDLPKVSHSLVQYTNDLWDFSYVFYKETGEDVADVLDGIEKSTEKFREKENVIEEDLKTVGGDWKRLFFGWQISLFEFWRQLSMVLARLTWGTQGQGRFTHLLTAFSRVCFLSPELGGAFAERLIVRDTVVRGSPAVCFNTFVNKCLTVFTVTQVKSYDAFRGSHSADTFTYKSIEKKVLGQHGIHLLMEREESLFFPYVVGVLCIGTHIILTTLCIEQDHIDQIEEKGWVDKTCRASISYTRPFDFMDASDRRQLLECFFWFGYVQSNAYQFKWK